jgi:hypothetical protein
MDCSDYTTNLVSAHADGELTPEELRQADEHLKGCPRCSARLQQEYTLKKLVHRLQVSTKTPETLLASINQSIERASKHEPKFHLWRTIAGSAAIAALLVGIVLATHPFHRTPATPDIPEFDQAVNSFTALEQNFKPNVDADSVPTLFVHYKRNLNFQVFVWDFSRVGMKLVGGRIDHLPDGRTVAYTMYQGPPGHLLCMRYKADLPDRPGGQEIGAFAIHKVYSYRGYTICVTQHGDAACFLISRMPAAAFVKAIEEIGG